jgi:hypothetical protein
MADDERQGTGRTYSHLPIIVNFFRYRINRGFLFIVLAVVFS